MKQVLASIGIGNATVDTVLPSTSVTPGESVDAEVSITGGEAEQEVGAIEFEIETRCSTEEGYEEADVDRMRLTDDLVIEPDDEETRQVTLDVPYTTPITLGNVDVWVETELDIDWAVDPEDRDYLDVQPTPRLQAVFDAIEDLGFSFRTAECEADSYGRYGTGQRFVQEFEFRPAAGPFRGDLDEVELIPNETVDELTLYVEVDRRGGMLSELADTDESKTSFTVTDDDPDADQVREQLRDLLERHA